MGVTLVVMAAGVGSRYGGIKQLDSFGPRGEVIMDYGVFDAVRAGFDKVVIVIRKEIEKDFREVIGNRLLKEACVPIIYTYQDVNILPEGFSNTYNRTKPWGTGQAVLTTKDYIDEPFLVINADDFYGRTSYEKMYKFLSEVKEEEVAHFCMAGYLLKNTLSNNGSVARGICKVDKDGYLVNIVEHLKVLRVNDKAEGFDSDGNKHILELSDVASMNMMGFTPKIFEYLESGFKDFLTALTPENALKSEFFLPKVVDDLIFAKKADMKVIDTTERWFGVTYKEDREQVERELKKLIEAGVYKEDLWMK